MPHNTPTTTPTRTNTKDLLAGLALIGGAYWLPTQTPIATQPATALTLAGVLAVLGTLMLSLSEAPPTGVSA